MSSVNERIEKLKTETANLRKEVQGLKEALLQQNELILNLLTKQNGMLDETVVLEPIVPQTFNGKNISEFFKRFPLKDLEDMATFEKQIKEENKIEIISIIEILLSPHGILKNITNVISEKIIVETSVDGYRSKQRLSSYPQTMDVIFLAARKDKEYSRQLFLDELRRAVRMVKTRYHRNKTQTNQKKPEEQEHNEEDQQEEEDDDDDEDTVEIYFE